MEQIQSYIIQVIKDAARQAAEQMIDEMGIDKVIKKLEMYPSMIKTHQHRLAAMQQELDDAKLDLEAVKADIMADINTATGENGKPLYSNEKAREAEFIRRANTSREYIDALDNYRAAEDKLNDAKFDLDEMYNEFSAQKAILAALTAKINILAGIQKI